jgi:tRNA(adenine34) deaminase
MELAIEQAKKCIKDVPIGCVIKRNGEIISATHNRREIDNDITAHAEILAIKEAQKKLNTSRLVDCEMYVTLEPCPMCSWAIIQSGIKTLYFGAYNLQYGGMGSCEELPLTKISNSKIKIYGGIEEETCNKILKDFFKGIR